MHLKLYLKYMKNFNLLIIDFNCINPSVYLRYFILLLSHLHCRCFVELERIKVFFSLFLNWSFSKQCILRTKCVYILVLRASHIHMKTWFVKSRSQSMNYNRKWRLPSAAESSNCWIPLRIMPPTCLGLETHSE